ncbi:zinc finger BED domain-containing protein DAYSLEEPER-like isoform X2 [Momordica charantia]|uniref:Zinc finger BED domain-containing protein DAYSLEEPER-like isoform X2 n=1 Tax=Momordica charantia TaxID=3673 RepID=A0A6J1DE80_MOMCH|nr:zinc finger BED domain-containing protein DAYSLEEPER-like isoform X2 [Momordica charantia]
MEDFRELISKVRNAVRFVRSSSPRYRSFGKCVKEENLSSKIIMCLDVPTRWDNTYMMLEGAVKFEKEFERLKIHDTTYLNEDIPASRDWEVVRTLVEFLSLFYEATLKLSTSVHVLSNSIFHEISTLQNYIKMRGLNSDNLVLNGIAMKVQTKYDKYWWNSESANYLIYVSVVLSPCCKMKFLSYCFRKLFDANVAQEMCKKVEDILRQLFNEYSLSIDNNDSPTPSMFHHSNTRECSTNDATDDEFDTFDYYYDVIHKFYAAMEEEDNLNLATEVDIYLLEACANQGKDFDILKWWKDNSSRYKVLGKIAREILAIPVSTIAAESAFDIGGRVIDSVCFTSAPNLVEVLACLQSWLNEDATSIDLREHIKDISHMEEEFLNMIYMNDISSSAPR